MDTPLSQSSVSLRLAEIQKRCSELMDDSSEPLELSLAEPDLNEDDRYTLQR